MRLPIRPSLGLVLLTMGLANCSSGSHPATGNDGGALQDASSSSPEISAALQDAISGSRDASADRAPADAATGCPRTAMLCNGACVATGQSAGNCTVMIMESESNSGWLALGTTHLYFTASPASSLDYSIKRIPLEGGSIETVTTGRSIIEGLTVDSAYIYFLEYQSLLPDDAIRRVPLAGGSVETLTEVAGSDSLVITTDGTYVYWTRDIPSVGFTPAIGNAVRRVPTTGGSVTEVANGASPNVVSVNDSHVFWADQGVLWKTAKTTIGAIPFSADAGVGAGGAIQIADSGMNSAMGIALDGDFIYWTSDGSSGLYRVPTAGGVSEKLANTGQSESLVADATNIYVATIGGEVVRVNKADHTAQTIATFAKLANTDLFIDAKNLYIRAGIMGANKGDSGVLKIRK